MSQLKILHAPLKAPAARKHRPALRKALAAHPAHSTGLTEAYGVLGTLRAIPGHRLVVEDGGKDKRRGQLDNPILVRDGLRSLGSGQVLGCHASTPLRLAPERWITYSAVQAAGEQVCHIVLHPHAGVQSKVTGKLNRSKRAAGYRHQLDALDGLLDLAAGLGWRIVVTGDLNFRDRKPVAGSPYELLRDHGLTVYSRGLDAVAWTPALGLTVRQIKAPASITDHPWLYAHGPKKKEKSR